MSDYFQTVKYFLVAVKYLKEEPRSFTGAGTEFQRTVLPPEEIVKLTGDETLYKALPSLVHIFVHIKNSIRSLSAKPKPA